MKYFNVAEKNSSAKSIAALFSEENLNWREGLSLYNKIYEFEANVEGKNSYMIMTSVHGHISHYEYLNGNNWNVDPISLFDNAIEKTYLTDETTINIVETLKREVVNNCQGLIIWTDCDREGENIGYEIMELCQRIKPNIQMYRAKFSEITKPSIQKALKKLEQPDGNQSQAVNVRSELSMRIGAVFSQFQKNLFQRKFPKVKYESLSYGITKFPTLGFVVQRHKEIENFTPKTFRLIKVLHTLNGQTVEFVWSKQEGPYNFSFDPFNNVKLNAVVENIVVEEKYMRRPLPMTTVELLKLGSQKLNIRANEIMNIAENLYRNGFISYPRTETNFFSTEINLRDLVWQQSDHADWGYFAKDILNWGIDPHNGSKTDQAHPPIYPTKCAYELKENERRVYELITRHFLACVSKDAKGLQTTVNINICGEKFVTIGSRILENNYLDVWPFENWTAKYVHSYEMNSNFEPTNISIEEETTTPPQLLTEADLISLMAENGVGTDATYAKHINNLEKHGHIVFNDKKITPGAIGLGLVEGYDAVGVPLAHPDLSSKLELELNLICTGLRTPADVLSEQIEKYKQIYTVVLENMKEIAAKIAYRLNVAPRNVELKCEYCDFPARLAQVKKEGPNKGRYFYNCCNPRNYKRCKQFVVTHALQSYKLII